MSTPPLRIIGCVKTKIDILPGALVPAMDLYDSPLWRKRHAYAEAGAAPWLILSAEYGLIEPGERVATYDTNISSVKPLRHGQTWWHSVTRERLWDLIEAARAADAGGPRGRTVCGPPA